MGRRRTARTPAQWVSEIRTRLGISQDMLARLFGAALVTIIRWESSANSPKGANLILLSALDLASKEDPSLGMQIIKNFRDQTKGLVPIWARIFELGNQNKE